MTCEELLEHLAAYVAYELQADVIALLERHASDCPSCGGMVETYQLTLIVVRALPNQCDPLPDGVANRLRAVLARAGFEVG